MADPRRSRRNPFSITSLDVFEINEVLRQIRLEIETLQNREHTHTGHDKAVDPTDDQEILQIVESSITPPVLVSNQHNYNPAGLADATIIRVSSEASRNITGLKAQPDGTIKRFFNYGTFNIVLKDASDSSQRLNRFDLTSDITIGPNETVSVQYATINNRARWRVIGNAGGASASALPDGDYGDITVSGGTTVLTIDNDAVTYAKMQNVSAGSKLIGRGDSGSGDPQEITLGSGLSMTGTTISASGGGSAHNLLDGSTHPDTVAQSVTRGSLIYGNATPKWDELNIGSAGTVLTSDGTDVSWVASAGGNTTTPSGLNEFNDGCLTTQIWEHVIAGENISINEIANGEAIELSASASPIPSGGNGLLTGGQILWLGGLQFLVSAATYRINGTDYASPQTTITLTVADANNDRIDAIIVNTSNVATFITGTPAASPAAPTADPETQLALTFVLVQANATVPGNVSLVNIYLENTEWTSSTNAPARINLASTFSPFAGSVSIETTAAVANDRFQFQSTAINPTQYNTLNFLIKNKVAWAANKSISIVFLNASGNPVGNVVTLDNGLFGFNHNNITDYQLIAISISAFNTGATVSGLRFTVVGSGAGLSFLMDNIILQGGATTVTFPDGIMLFKGDWSNTITYSIDDVVTDGGASWIALSPNTGVHPSDSTVLWRKLGIQDEVEDASISTQPWEELIEDETMRILGLADGSAALLRALNVITVGDDLVGDLQLVTDGNSALIYA